MRTQTDISVGRAALTPVTAPRLQTAGGRRPPDDRRPRRCTPLGGNRRGRRHLRYLSGAIAGVVIGASLANAQPTTAPLPNLSGTYRCGGDSKKCEWSGRTFSVVQEGDTLDVKNDKGAVGEIKLDSDIALSAGPPWNMLGVILPNKVIQWSNGTNWRKQ